MKLELVSPFKKLSHNIGQIFQLPQMALALIAGITPEDIDVSITDEMVRPIDFDKPADLVGITVNTKTAVRAYKIADEYRRRGVPVILGGIHPKVARKEAIQHADSLVLGEVEEVWDLLLEDFKKGFMKEYYSSDVYPNLDILHIPRRDLLPEGNYETINLVQASRGCPYACHFCTVSALYGKGVRLKPVDNVIAEIETLRGDEIFFVDDNIVGRVEYSKELLSRLIPLKKKWIGQATVNVAKNNELLRLIHKSGGEGLFVGFETVSINGLKEVGKLQNINHNYFESIARMHDNGISIMGSFIVGFDSDDKSCFEDLLEFVSRSKIDVVDISVLTPYPGTILYEKLKEENRLIDESWWLKYDSDEVVFEPRQMAREELYEGRNWVLKEIYRLGPTLKRWGHGLNRRTIFGNILNWKVGMGYRRNAYTEKFTKDNLIVET